MDDIQATRALLSRQLAEAIASDPLAALSTIADLQKETSEHLREAVRQASSGSSWGAIATELGVSKQAAHQRFNAYAKDVTSEIKSEHRAMKRARRHGDPDRAATALARRDELVAELKASAKALADQK